MKVSVVTPSYNQAEFLGRTLSSVLDQKGAAFEYIVVDGNSSDGSQEILEKVRNRLDHLIIEPDDGQADAIRKGFAHSTGEILCYLNSDDLLLPGTLAFVTQYFAEHPGIDAIYSHRIFVDEHDHVTRFWTLPPHQNYCMSRWDFIPQETCFWRRELMDRAGSIDPSFGFALDYDLFVRMMKSGKFVRVPKFLSAFRVHPTAKSSTLYETVGRQEVERIRFEQGLKLNWYDHLLKYLFGASILGTSFAFKMLFINGIRRDFQAPRGV